MADMILSKKRIKIKYCGHDIEATEIIADSVSCPELNKYIDQNRRSKFIVVHIEREISRFELIDFEL